ncbi:MAG: hypothetical protein DMG81_05510 [Acidobacteria bacterium]|nr:MAG: hypothetical protein DMG81_05510 [Acidobacteriota bacterium]
MKDVHELLREKEMECVRVQKEIDALRLVIPLMGGEQQTEPDTRKQPETVTEPQENASNTGTEGPTFSALKSETSFWKRRR